MKRREFIKQVAYVAPIIVTLNAVPTLAAAGSYTNQPAPRGNEGVGNGYDAPPPGHNYNWNDDYGTGPGQPGSQP